MGPRDSVRVEVTGLDPHGPATVAFPRLQPGVSALVGFYEHDRQPYILKIPKTRDVRHAFARNSVNEPAVVTLVRRGTARWNSLAPAPAAWPTLERFNGLCHGWLRSVPRGTAQEALVEVPGARERTVACLVDELFDTHAELSFAPQVSRVVRIALAGDGPRDVFAVVQDNVGPPDSYAVPFRRPIALRSHQPTGRLRELEFLALVAYACLLAGRHGLGLDLAPRADLRTFSMPNVLVRHGRPGLAYTDYFGLAQRDGNVIEAAAFAALYGSRGAARHLCGWVYRSLAAWRPFR